MRVQMISGPEDQRDGRVVPAPRAHPNAAQLHRDPSVVRLRGPARRSAAVILGPAPAQCDRASPAGPVDRRHLECPVRRQAQESGRLHRSHRHGPHKVHARGPSTRGGQRDGDDRDECCTSPHSQPTILLSCAVGLRGGPPRHCASTACAGTGGPARAARAVPSRTYVSPSCPQGITLDGSVRSSPPHTSRGAASACSSATSVRGKARST